MLAQLVLIRHGEPLLDDGTVQALGGGHHARVRLGKLGHDEDGDYVIETASVPEAQAKLAEAFALFGMCDAAHVIPAGVYLEE